MPELLSMSSTGARGPFSASFCRLTVSLVIWLAFSDSCSAGSVDLVGPLVPMGLPIFTTGTGRDETRIARKSN